MTVPVVEPAEVALERRMIAAAVRVLDRRAAALRADASGDAAARVSRARTVRLLEECAGDVAALLGPIVPAQGRLALETPGGGP